MEFQQKTEQLKGIIAEHLDPLIDTDYVLLDLPHYENTGDILIWQGELDYLARLPYRCLYSASHLNYRTPRIDANTLILLQGGGNFGDLWPDFQQFRLRVIEEFPDNRIIILPQTIHYGDHGNMLRDAELFGRHKSLTICVRDHQSLAVLDRFFPGSRHLLLPDMAFCIDMGPWERYRSPQRDEALFLKRQDKELDSACRYDGIVPDGTLERDWPSFERLSPRQWLVYKLAGPGRRLPPFVQRPIDRMLGRMGEALRKEYMKTGVRFLSGYSDIYTTRLHTAILSALLGKPFVLFDNSYGKNSAFFDAWLQDLEGAHMQR